MYNLCKRAILSVMQHVRAKMSSKIAARPRDDWFFWKNIVLSEVFITSIRVNLKIIWGTHSIMQKMCYFICYAGTRVWNVLSPPRSSKGCFVLHIIRFLMNPTTEKFSSQKMCLMSLPKLDWRWYITCASQDMVIGAQDDVAALVVVPPLARRCWTSCMTLNTIVWFCLERCCAHKSQHLKLEVR